MKFDIGASYCVKLLGFRRTREEKRGARGRGRRWRPRQNGSWANFEREMSRIGAGASPRIRIALDLDGRRSGYRTGVDDGAVRS